MTSIERMLYGATSFNRPLARWDVSRVTSMRQLFSFAHAFDQPLSEWHTPELRDLGEGFAYALRFNQGLAAWDTSRVSTLEATFAYAWAFNAPLAGWDVSRVITTDAMFYRAYAFNQPLGAWRVTALRSAAVMFEFSFAFDQDLNTWDMARVTTLEKTFARATAFNGAIAAWDTSRVQNMALLFAADPCTPAHARRGCRAPSAFNQDLSRWSVEQLQEAHGMLAGTATLASSTRFRTAHAFLAAHPAWDACYLGLEVGLEGSERCAVFAPPPALPAPPLWPPVPSLPPPPRHAQTNHDTVDVLVVAAGLLVAAGLGLLSRRHTLAWQRRRQLGMELAACTPPTRLSASSDEPGEVPLDSETSGLVHAA